jgi:hypothetical protein
LPQHFLQRKVFGLLVQVAETARFDLQLFDQCVAAGHVALLPSLRDEAPGGGLAPTGVAHSAPSRRRTQAPSALTAHHFRQKIDEGLKDPY